MRKIIACEFMTLDSVVQGGGRPGKDKSLEAALKKMLDAPLGVPWRLQ
jgi:hypothetical protein